MLDQLDEEFGIGDLIKEEVQADKRTAYSERDLRGLKVEHKIVISLYFITVEFFYFYYL